MTYPKGGSEYGGYPGLVQPEPHPFGDGKGSASEQLLAAYLTDAADAESSPQSVVDSLRAQGRKDQAKQNG